HTPLFVTVADNGPFDANPADGQFLLKPFQSFLGSALTGLALGTYTVQETVAPAGYNLSNVIQTAVIDQDHLSVVLVPFVDTRPHLTITKNVTGDGTSAVIHPGGTASFTITVTNDGDGAANNVVVTDNLPEPTLLAWTVSNGGFDSTTFSGPHGDDTLTATKATLDPGKTITLTVSAVVPLGIFGNAFPPGQGNRDPLPANLFELDADDPANVTNSQVAAFDQSGVPGDDWSSALGFDVAGVFGSSNAHSFVTDKTNSNTDDIFQGGGSKDVSGIQQGPWLFTASKPQAKDDIEHAFAATYVDPATNDVILYPGLDRSP